MIDITADFDENELEKMIQEDFNYWVTELTSDLMTTGKTLIDKAITKVSADSYGKVFGNITYNLRSSMGCGVSVDGVVKEKYFPFGKADEGRRHGIAYLEKIASQEKDGIKLIMVAGEFYAEYVQAKQFDVDRGSLANFAGEFDRRLNG